MGYIRSAGAAKHEIVEYARRKGVDLIVIGSHGKRGVERMLGSVVNRVMQHALCDLLMVRL